MPDEKNKRKSLFKRLEEERKKRESRKLHELSEKRRAESLAESKRTEEYDRRIKKEKIILLKIRRGIINKENTEFRTVCEPRKEFSFRQKLQANLAFYKPMICLGTVFSLIGAYLAYDLTTKPKPDFTALMLTNDSAMISFTSGIEKLLCEYITDSNGNGENEAKIFCECTSSGNMNNNMYSMDSPDLPDSTTTYTIMRSGDTIMILSVGDADKNIYPDESLEPLEKYYPDNEHVKGYGFYISDTDFGEDIGCYRKLPDDMYIGLRKVQNNAFYCETMQENFDEAKKILDALVSRYT